MNLYDIHDKPEDLHRHKDADTNVPQLFWKKYRKSPKELKKREDAIAADTKFAFEYAVKVLKQPWPKGEDAILKDPEYTFLYAFSVLDKPWPKGEKTLLKNGEWAAVYAIDVLQKPWPEAEPAIVKSRIGCKAYLETFPERKDAIDKLS